MFEQHPVPQNIASYQFRLVGDMTLKQFFQLAGGALLAILVYSFPLPAIFKWPLVVIFVLSGAAFAFLPIQERPLSLWVSSFIRSIYAPTVYIWQQQKSYQFFAPESTQISTQQDPTTANISDAQLAAPVNPAHVSNLEEGEKTMLNKITGLFGFGGTKQSQPLAQPAPKPAPQPQQQTPAPTPPTVNQNAQPAVVQPKKEVVVPQKQPVKVDTQQRGFEQPNANQQKPTEITQQKLEQTLTEQAQSGSANKANFSNDAAPPTPPTKENVVVGQVIDSNGKIVEGAILEIKDSNGRPVRALKTNKVGHFLIVTPLNNGKYTIHTEKDGLEFDTIEIEAKGEIIKPIAIKAKQVVQKGVVQ